MDHAADELDVFRDLVVNCRPFKEISPVPGSNINTEAINSFAKKVAEKYYHIRNQAVHQFWLETEEECNNDDWNALILFSLKFVRRLYEKHLTADPAAGADLGLSEADEVSLVLS